MATVNYDIDYNDSRFKEVEADKKSALTSLEQTYGNMINQSDKYYQDQINASKDYAETQKKNQQAQTDFAIQQIEQNKAQAKKDYTKEQSGAYVDWQKQSNQYGATAEQQAAMGMAGTGYSESSQVSMYNTYQNRVATAREAYTLAVQNYNNSITEARLQNNSILAEIAYNALQQQLELSLQGFQYKNQLVLEKANRKTELENTYYQRYQDVVDQINAENKFAEEQRQYNETLALQKAQLKLDQDEFAWQKEQVAKSSSGGDDSKGNGNSGKIIKNASSLGLDVEGFKSEVKNANNDKGVITTDYYNGKLPLATVQAIKTYGAFENTTDKNGTVYQPKGISGYGKLKKTGKTTTINVTTLSGKERTVTQNIWKTPDGTKWIWDRVNMKYVRA